MKYDKQVLAAFILDYCFTFDALQNLAILNYTLKQDNITKKLNPLIAKQKILKGEELRKCHKKITNLLDLSERINKRFDVEIGKIKEGTDA
jgi:hypothetical protein